MPSRDDANRIPRVQKPWHLKGNAVIAALKLSRRRLLTDGFVPGELTKRLKVALSFFCYVDYTESDVGPYREIVFLPGGFRFGRRTCGTISKIYVSTWASVVNGRENWGIPKEQADFDVCQTPYGARIRVSREGALVASFTVKSRGRGLPASSRLIPSRLRTLAQETGKRSFYYTPQVRSTILPARILDFQSDPFLFPDIAPCKTLLMFKLAKFELVFPEAVIRTHTACGERC